MTAVRAFMAFMIWGKRQKNKWTRLQTTGKSYGNKVQDAVEGVNGQDSGPVWRDSDQRSGTFPRKLILRWESKMSWFFCLECLPPQRDLGTSSSCFDSSILLLQGDRWVYWDGQVSLQVLTIIQGTFNVPFVLVIVGFLSDALTWDAALQGSCSSYFAPTVALPLRPEPDLSSTYVLTD